MLNKLVATCEKDETNCYMNIGRFAGSLDYDPGVINIPVRAWRQALDYLLKDLLKCSDSTCVKQFKKENSFHMSVVSVHLAAKFNDDLHDLQRQYWACLAYF
ncbi:hypothetical protein CAEBREN_15369 [Caenorhabditis brenneri]|uniref:Uncharacterized protein n=1 Tax=Caenorhabditis brenneri TaxID=135651 RepID=G0MR79_CAEBE|nr:hypothetical protein CAEBREN_15369 [Caenorhabditis brenneri]